MTVETATYITELVPANTGSATDPIEGGDQIALVKTVLQNTFPNADGPINATDTQLNALNGVTFGVAASSKAVTVSASATITMAGITWTDMGIVTTIDINGGTMDATPVGATTPSTGAFTTLTASGAVTFTSGTLNGVSVGATTPSTGAFTTLTASAAVTFTTGTINGVVIGGTTPAAATFTTLVANTSLVINGSAAITSIDTDLSTVSASDDTLASAKAIDAQINAKARTILSAMIVDVSTADTQWLVVPVAGTILRMDTVLEGVLTVADAVVTLKTAADLAIASNTIAFTGSAAGDVDTDAAPTNATVTAGQALKLATDGGSTGTQRVWVSILIGN